MKDNPPFILSIIGQSDSGKTTLILKLLPELKKRGYKIAVAKHCPCGFDLDIEGKDSWKFTQQGAAGTFLSSEEAIALLRPKEGSADTKKNLEKYFSDFDFVLMEGYNKEPGIKKMQIIRKGIGAAKAPANEIVAYITDMQLNVKKPVFHLDDILAIISFIEDLKDNQ